MPDNVGYTPGSGATVAADEINGVLHQRVKIGVGDDGTAQDVSKANPLPAAAQRSDDLLEMIMRLVKISETLQVVDSAQRQRIAIDSIAAGVTLPTVSSVTNVAAQTGMAGMDREMYINIAKQTYAQSIRANLKIQ